MGETFQLARERLQTITLIVGEAVGSLLAVVFYFTFLVPFALISTFATDPLQRRARDEPSWLTREPVSTEIDRARRQG